MNSFGALNALKDYLKDNLNTALTTAGLDTVDTTNGIKIGAVDPLAHNGTAVLFFLPERTVYNDTEDGTLGGDIATLELKLYVLIRGGTTATLWENIYGYVEAVRSVIYDDPTLGDEVGETYINQFDVFEGILEHQKNEQRLAEITITVVFEEAR